MNYFFFVRLLFLELLLELFELPLELLLEKITLLLPLPLPLLALQWVTAAGAKANLSPFGWMDQPGCGGSNA